MYSIVLVLFLILVNVFKISHELYFRPDLTNPSIPSQWRQMCGYRNRPLIKDISYSKKCFINSYENRLAFNLPLDVMSGDSDSVPSGRVLSGKNSRLWESPWTVQITRKALYPRSNYKLYTHYDPHCTGVLITMRHILTAAHCYGPDDKFAIFAGSESRFKFLIPIPLEFIPHPNYSTPLSNGSRLFRSYNDIAIIKLDKPIDWDRFESPYSRQYYKNLRLNTICLPNQYEILTSSINDPDKYQFQAATFFGWGKSANETNGPKLQRADIYVESDGYFFRSHNIGTRGCKGDSGSGLVQYLDKYETRAVLIGIVIKIYEVTDNSVPCYQGNIGQTISVKVSKHLKWINKHLK